MKSDSTEAREIRVDGHIQFAFAVNDRNLLNGLPYPTAVFRAADGCLIHANQKLLSYLKWPPKKKTGSNETAPGDLPTGFPKCTAGDILYMRALKDGIIELVSPDGFKSLIKADTQTILFEGQDAWLVTVAVHVRQGSSGKKSRDEEHHYRELVENMRDIVYTTDRNAVVTYVSPNIFHLSGYLPHEVIGRIFTDFVHPDDLGGRLEQFTEIMGGADKSTEFRFVIKTGEVKWVRTSARPIIRNARVLGVQGILSNISDRKEIEEALRSSEEKYRNVVLNSKDAIFVIQDECLQFMNPNASKILRHTLQEAADKPFWEFIHPDDRAELISRYHLRLRGKSISDRATFRITNKARDIRDAELKSVTISWEGRPAVLCFLRDITIQKKMEDQLRNLQKIEALGALSSGIAHNFNNLLMGIHGNIALTMAETPMDTTAYGYLKKVISLVQSGSKLTRQLLGYARGWGGDMGALDLNQLVRETVDTLGATKKHILISCNLCDKIPPIKADREQMEQALLNLLLNAADAMPDGGEVFIETDCLRGDEAGANAALLQDMSYALIKVTDHGAGIPPNILHRIFEPFFTTKGMGRGTGLGLSTAYGIVKNHHGDITVSSKPGKGSTFQVYLPMVPADTALTAANADPRKVVGQGTILLVEDEPAVLGPSAQMLEKLGFSVLKADCGLVALEIFQNHWKEIDLVILDLILPQMGGKDLYFRFKEIHPQVKVLLSSGYSLSSQAEKLIEKGCLGFLQKPYTMDTLSIAMMEILSPE